MSDLKKILELVKDNSEGKKINLEEGCVVEILTAYSEGGNPGKIAEH